MFVYLLISLVILILFSKLSYKFNLVDIPNRRKKHSKPTAYTGGIALSFIYLISLFLFQIDAKELNLILSLAFLISVVGFLDDKYHLNVGSKLSLQILPIFFLIFLENLSLNQIGNYDYFKLELNSFSIPFTVFSVLLLINSYNYFDGLDGILSFSTISVLAILYFLTNDENNKLFLIIICAPLFLFLFFNFSLFKLPKLFLGDSGSLLLGFITAFTLIYYANEKLVHPILLAWSVSIFIYEFLSINIIRIYNNKNPFLAGRDHLHHILFKRTKSIIQTNFFIFLINIILFTIGYISFVFVGPLISLILFISFFLFFFIIRKNLKKNN